MRDFIASRIASRRLHTPLPGGGGAINGATRGVHLPDYYADWCLNIRRAHLPVHIRQAQGTNRHGLSPVSRRWELSPVSIGCVCDVSLYGTACKEDQGLTVDEPEPSLILKKKTERNYRFLTKEKKIPSDRPFSWLVFLMYFSDGLFGAEAS